MLYRLLRALARVTLRSYYREVRVQGHHHIPVDTPIVVVANHPNALVDAMLVATTLERRVFITARETLFDSRPLSAVLRHVGVIPLRRMEDIPLGDSTARLRTRNDASRALVLEVLKQRDAVLIFPEGGSHDLPYLARLKSGAARVAIQAHQLEVRNLRILPVGLIYEAKEQLYSRVLVRIGAPVDIDSWCHEHSISNPSALTRELTRRLDNASLGFASQDRALRAVRFVSALAGVHSFAGLMGEDADTEKATGLLQHASLPLLERIDRFVDEVEAMTAQLRGRGLVLEEHTRSLEPKSVLRSTSSFMRDISVAIFLFPLALLGQAVVSRVLRVAHWVALQSLRHNESRDQPAMRTILIALLSVPLWCALMAGVLGPGIGMPRTLFLFAVLLAACITHASYHDTVVNAARRLPAYFMSRAGEQATLLSTGQALRKEARALETALLDGEPEVS